MADRWITTSNRAAWLDARRSLVTASDLPVVMGLYGKGRLRDLVREKLGLDDPWGGNLLTEMGKALEPWIYGRVAAGEVEALPDGRYIHNDTDSIRLAEDRRHGATVDLVQYVGDSTQPFAVWDMKHTTYKSENMPSEGMIAQVNWQMYCLDVDHGGIVGAHRFGAYLRAFPVERDETLIERMIEVANVLLDGLDSTDADALAEAIEAASGAGKEDDNGIEI